MFPAGAGEEVSGGVGFFFSRSAELENAIPNPQTVKPGLQGEKPKVFEARVRR